MDPTNNHRPLIAAPESRPQTSIRKSASSPNVSSSRQGQIKNLAQQVLSPSPIPAEPSFPQVLRTPAEGIGVSFPYDIQSPHESRPGSRKITPSSISDEQRLFPAAEKRT